MASIGFTRAGKITDVTGDHPPKASSSIQKLAKDMGLANVSFIRSSRPVLVAVLSGPPKMESDSGHQHTANPYQRGKGQSASSVQ